MREESLFKAIKYFGSQKNLANALGVSQQMVCFWLNKSKKIPYEQALKIFLYTGGEIRIEGLTSEEKELTILVNHVFLLGGTPIAYIPIEQIDKGEKQCPLYKNYNELPYQTTSIYSERPILVSYKNQLITCECRLRGYRSKNSKVKVLRLNAFELLKSSINIRSILRDFPVSERVEVGMFIEQELGNRRGRRVDLELPENFPEVRKNRETREIAAEIAGFGNCRTYYQAKEVIKNGLPEVIKAMDEGILAVSKAKLVSDLPDKKQYHFMETIKQKEKIGKY